MCDTWKPIWEREMFAHIRKIESMISRRFSPKVTWFSCFAWICAPCNEWLQRRIVFGKLDNNLFRLRFNQIVQRIFEKLKTLSTVVHRNVCLYAARLWYDGSFWGAHRYFITNMSILWSMTISVSSVLQCLEHSQLFHHISYGYSHLLIHPSSSKSFIKINSALHLDWNVSRIPMKLCHISRFHLSTKTKSIQKSNVSRVYLAYVFSFHSFLWNFILFYFFVSSFFDIKLIRTR